MVFRNCLEQFLYNISITRYLIILQPENYKLGQQENMECPTGSQLVTDENECRSSAATINKPFTSVGCHYTVIAGCYYSGHDDCATDRSFLPVCCGLQYQPSSKVFLCTIRDLRQRNFHPANLL